MSGYGIGTLDVLIRNIETKMKINDPYNDNLYLKKFKEFLECMRCKYGNIPTVALYSLMESSNNRKFNYIDIERKKIAEHFENIERLKTNSKKYYLISVEYHKYRNGYPILIIGAPDGLNFEGNMNNEARMYEIKTYNLMYSYTIYRSNEGFIKKVLDMVNTTSKQLILYQYLLKNTAKLGLIEEPDNTESHGIISFYSKNIRDVYSAKRIIKQNFNRIAEDANEYNAYNLSLKEEEKTYMDGEILYYFKIIFKVRYDEDVVENHLNNLDKLLKSLKSVDNRNL